MKSGKYFLIFIAYVILGCQSAQTKKDYISEQAALNPYVEKFFSEPSGDEEALRVFVSSDNYIPKQSHFDDTMKIIIDHTGRYPMSDEIANYDMINLFTEAVYRVELYEDSGLISHIRPVRPSKISEINKIIADDITRLKFKFQDKDKPQPLTFNIKYGVQLQKKKTREEIKKILEENVRH